MLRSRPDPHLRVFAPLPTGNDVDAEPAVRDRIDRDRHARGYRRGHGQYRAGGEQPNPARHRSQPGHQCEGFQIVIPKLRRAAKPVQFDHRQSEIEAEPFGLLHDLAVEVETRPILRRGRRNQPAIVADRNKDTEFHGFALAPAQNGSGISPRLVVGLVTATRMPTANSPWDAPEVGSARLQVPTTGALARSEVIDRISAQVSRVLSAGMLDALACVTHRCRRLVGGCNDRPFRPTLYPPQCSRRSRP